MNNDLLSNGISYFAFRGFKKYSEWVELEIEPLTILIGPNNSGKSTIFKAMKFVDERILPIQNLRSLIIDLSDNEAKSFHGEFEFKVDVNLYQKLGVEEFDLHGLDEGNTQAERTANKLGRPAGRGRQQSYLLQKAHDKNMFLLHFKFIKQGNTLKLSSLNYLFIDDFKPYTLVPSHIDQEPSNYSGGGRKVYYLENHYLPLSLTQIVKLCSILDGKTLMPDDNTFVYNREKVKSSIQDYRIEGEENDEWFEDEGEDVSGYLHHKGRFFECYYLPEVAAENIEDIVHKALFMEPDTVAFFEGEWYLNKEINITLEYNEPYIAEAEERLKSQGIILKSLRKEFLNLIDKFFSIIDKLNEQPVNKILALDSLPMIKAQSRAIYNKKEPLGNLLSIMVNQLSNEDVLLLCKKWLKKAKIGDEIEIKEVVNEEYVVNIINNEKTQDLASLGSGSLQLLGVIFSCFQRELNDGIQKKYDVLNDEFVTKLKTSTKYIEEPETNLHPKLQSMLADIFCDAVNIYSQNDNVCKTAWQSKFLIETHSEYLVRKLQLNVASKQIDKNQVVLYYLPDSSIDSGGIRKINIQNDGSLSEPFGAGFYDEALNWKLELLKLKNKN